MVALAIWRLTSGLGVDVSDKQRHRGAGPYYMYTQIGVTQAPGAAAVAVELVGGESAGGDNVESAKSWWLMSGRG